jgi:uncharacterized membrane protein YhfC
MDLLLFTNLLNGLLMTAIPIGLGFYLTRRFRLGWRLWWIGAATFVLSQIGHIPFNWLLTRLFQSGVLPLPPATWRLVFYAVVLGLSVGLWEELTRYAVYRWWAKDARSWNKGVLMGAGHGGIEAIILGVLVLYTFMNMVALRNTDLAQVVPASQLALAQQQVSAYWSSPWLLSILGAVERSFTIPCQIAFSVLVLQAFTRGKFRWVWLAVLWHAILDASAVYLLGVWAAYPWALYAIEGVIGVAALISLAIIFALRQPEPEPAAPEEMAPLPAPVNEPVLIPIEETFENLNKTRYN